MLPGYVGDSKNTSALEERAWQIVYSWKWRELGTEPSEGTAETLGTEPNSRYIADAAPTIGTLHTARQKPRPPVTQMDANRLSPPPHS